MLAEEGQKTEEDEEANMEWGKGLVQKKDAELKAELSVPPHPHTPRTGAPRVTRVVRCR